MTWHMRRDERGAFLLLFALLLVFLLTLVAFAVDLGQGRFQRRHNQEIADLASLAAGQYLAGYNGTSTVQASPFDACVAAFSSVQTNADDFRPIASQSEIETACSGFYDPFTDPITDACDPLIANPTPDVATLSRGPYTVTVRYPIPAIELNDPRFGGGTGANDGNDPCARMRVSVDRTDETAFASVIGVDEVRSSGSAVVKGALEDGGRIVPAFLILERYKCGALGNSVGGDSLGIFVQASATQSGRIHVDSDASGAIPTDCANSTTSAGGVTTWATPLPSGGTSLTLEALNAANPGILSIVASPPRDAGGGGINVDPTQGVVVSRSPVDDVFNDSDNPAIDAMHAAAHPWVASTINLGTTDTALTSAEDWLELDCDLAPTIADIVDVAEENWFVNCPGGYTPASATAITSPTGHADLVAPTRIVFSDSVNVPNGAELNAAGVELLVVRDQFSSSGDTVLPDVEHFYVRDGVSVSGSLRVGTSGLPAPDGDGVDTVCDSESPHDESIEMVVFFDSTIPSARAMTISGDAALCETTVYLAGPSSRSAFQEQWDTTTSAYGCEPDYPCPASVTVVSNARWRISGLVEWTAPNRYYDGAPDPWANPAPTARGREDLMFWSEAERVSEVASGGTLVSTGVFVGPNMRVEMRSPADAEPANAQFIARQLFLFQGTLNMLPQPNDTIDVPEPGSYSLIR